MTAGHQAKPSAPWFRIACAFLMLLAAGTYLHAQTPQTALSRAEQLMQHRQYSEVVTLLENDLADPHTNNDAYTSGRSAMVLGGAYNALGEKVKAIRNWETAISGFERANDKISRRECHQHIAQAQSALLQFKEAIRNYRMAVTLDEQAELYSRVEDMQSLAWVLEKDKDFNGALKIWEQLLKEEAPEKKGNTGEFLLNVAAMNKKLGNTALAAEQEKKGERLKNEALTEVQKAHGDGGVDQLYFEAANKAASGDAQGAYNAYQAMLQTARKKGYKSGIVTALIQLGIYDGNSGRTNDALKELEEAARLTKEDGQKNNESAALLYLGMLYNNVGNFSKGLEALNMASAICVAGHDYTNETGILSALRFSYFGLGDFSGALRTNAEMLEIAKRTGSRRQFMEAEYDIGMFYEDIGDRQTTLEHYASALELAKQLGDREKTAEKLNGYGIALMNLGDQNGAQAAFRESLAIRDWGGGRINMAESYLFKGDLEKAAELLRPINPYHIDMGPYYLAKQLFSDAQKTYKKYLPGGSDPSKDVKILFAARTGMGLTYEGTGDYIRAAYHFREAEKLLERQRNTLSLENRLYFISVVDWLQPHIEPYEGMVRISEFLPGGLRDSLYHAEFTRGRLFTESAARNYGVPDTRIPELISAAETRLNRIVATAAMQAEAANRGTDTKLTQQRDAEFSAAKKEQQKFVGDLRGRFPEYAAVRYPQPMYAEEFSLQPDEVLLEFEVTRPYTKAFLVRNGRVVLGYDIKLSREELDVLVRRYRSFFENVSGSAQLASFDPKLGEQLYTLLLKPAFDAKENGKPVIGPDSRIILAPDEMLSVLPFESLVVRSPARTSAPAGRFGPVPVGVKYVGDSWDIAYTHSGTALSVERRLKAKAEPPLDLLVLADPIFNLSDSRLRGSPEAKAWLNKDNLRTMGAIGATMGLGGARGTTRSKNIAPDNFMFPRLEKTGLLAEALKNKIFRNRQTEILISSSASKSELLKRSLADYRYIVIATHGILDNMIPGVHEPALVLSQTGTANDGLLTMSEVMKLKLNADIVALTACQTGLGKHLTGEGVMGLGRAFQYAGARNVLVSLWNVSEDSTTMLAERFFALIRQGKTPRQALRTAREYVRKAGYEHPFYWAPFILITE